MSTTAAKDSRSILAVVEGVLPVQMDGSSGAPSRGRSAKRGMLDLFSSRSKRDRSLQGRGVTKSFSFLRPGRGSRTASSPPDKRLSGTGGGGGGGRGSTVSKAPSRQASTTTDRVVISQPFNYTKLSSSQKPEEPVSSKRTSAVLEGAARQLPTGNFDRASPVRVTAPARTNVHARSYLPANSSSSSSAKIEYRKIVAPASVVEATSRKEEVLVDDNAVTKMRRERERASLAGMEEKPRNESRNNPSRKDSDEVNAAGKTAKFSHGSPPSSPHIAITVAKSPALVAQRSPTVANRSCETGRSLSEADRFDFSSSSVLDDSIFSDTDDGMSGTPRNGEGEGERLNDIPYSPNLNIDSSPGLTVAKQRVRIGEERKPVETALPVSEPQRIKTVICKEYVHFVSLDYAQALRLLEEREKRRRRKEAGLAGSASPAGGTRNASKKKKVPTATLR